MKQAERQKPPTPNPRAPDPPVHPHNEAGRASDREVRRPCLPLRLGHGYVIASMYTVGCDYSSIP